MVCTLLAGVNVVAFAADDETVSISKFYNDAKKGGDGEHLFTKDADEMSWLSGLPTWDDQDEAWKAPVSSSLAIYRVFNSNSGEHHYAAADEAEWLVSQGWTQEKLAFYSDDNKGVPIYRLWNGKDGVGSHYYTTDEGEAAYLASISWTAEGVNFYGVKEEEPTELEIEGEQVGAYKIYVTSNLPLTEEDVFSVDDLEEDVDFTVELDVDGLGATITFLDELVDDVYVVTVTPADPTIEKAYTDVTCEAAHLESINIGDTLINTAANAYTVTVMPEDQFGDAYPLTDGDFDAKIFSSGNKVTAYVYDPLTNTMTITNATQDIIGTQETIILSADGIVGKNTATYSVGSIPTMVVASSILMTDEEAAKHLVIDRIDVDDLWQVHNGYYFAVDVIDQYGQKITDQTALNGAVDNDYLVVTGNGVIEATGGNAPFTVVDGQPVVFIEKTTLTPGTGTLTFLPVTNPEGAATASVDVSANETLASVSVAQKEANLRQGSPIEVEITAVNSYGEDVDVDSELKVVNGSGSDALTFNYKASGNSQVQANAARISLVNATMSYTNGTAKTPAVATITAKAGQTNVLVVASAATTQQFNFTAEPAAAPTGIYSLSPNLKSTVAYGTAGDAGTGVDTAAVIIKDQYGEPMNVVPTFKGITGKTLVSASGASIVYTISEKRTTAATKADATNGIVYKAQADEGKTAKTDTYVITAWVMKQDINNAVVSIDNAAKLETVDFAVTVASATYVDYDASLESIDGLLYTGDTSAKSGDGDEIELYGIDASDNIIKLNIDGTTFKTVFRNGTDTYTTGLGGVIQVSTGGQITVNHASSSILDEGTAIIDVYAGNQIIASVEVAYSSATPQTQTFICTDATGSIYDLSKGFTVSNNGGQRYYFTAQPGAEALFIRTDDTAIDPAQKNAQYTIMALNQYGLSDFTPTFGGAAITPNASAVFGTTSGSLVLSSGDLVQIVNITVAQ